MKNLAQELLQEVMPWVEKNYRVLTGPQNTAMTGLSMGGGQAMVMGVRHPETFGWIGEFSSGLLSDKDLQIDSLLPGRIQASLNQQLQLLWIGCGRDDPRYPGHLALTALLKKRGIHFVFDSEPGGHEWKVWRLELHGFLQKVFQP
jgi:enterochelin esterase family protein